MRKISFLGLMLLLSSFILWPGRKKQIETEVDFDYKTYTFMKNNNSIIDSVFRFTYQVKGNKSSFSFRENYDISLKDKLVMVTLVEDTICQIKARKDSCMYTLRCDIGVIDSNIIKKIRFDALYYGKLFKKIKCAQVGNPRIGFGLMYFTKKNIEPNNDLVLIEGNWYYDCGKWKGNERKYLLKMIDKKFGTSRTSN
jgi:hypothetical protein